MTDPDLMHTVGRHPMHLLPDNHDEPVLMRYLGPQWFVVMVRTHREDDEANKRQWWCPLEPLLALIDDPASKPEIGEAVWMPCCRQCMAGPLIAAEVARGLCAECYTPPLSERLDELYQTAVRQEAAPDRHFDTLVEAVTKLREMGL